MEDNIGEFEYPEGIKKEFVDIPLPIRTFFKARGAYISLQKSPDKNTAITYSAIVGKDAETIPGEYFREPKLMETTDEYSFTNKEPKSKKDSETAILNALAFLLGKGKYSHIKKAYMLNTSTVPIRVTFAAEDCLEKTIYAKRPDTNRIIGKYLYNLTSGIEESRFAFNRAVFLEEGIKGNLVSRIDEDVYLRSQDYREGIIRAAIHSDFLGLCRDVKRGRNRIVDQKLRTVLFDFNLIFCPKDNLNRNYLLEEYSKYKDLIDEHLVKVYIEEQHKVAKRVTENHKDFFRFCRFAGKLVDATNNSTDIRVRMYYGAKSLEDFYERKVREYEQA